jgi:hypothetical protein
VFKKVFLYIEVPRNGLKVDWNYKKKIGFIDGLKDKKQLSA